MTALNAAAPRITDRLCEACAAHFEAVKAHLTAVGVTWRVEPALVRGLDYYTRTAFEFYVAGREGQQQALGGGGRYDGLVELLGGKPTPGIGFGLGPGPRRARAGASRGVPSTPSRARSPWSSARIPRTPSRASGSPPTCGRRGLRVRADLARRKLGRQLEAAGKDGAHFAVIIGDELAAGQVQVRDLLAGHAAGRRDRRPRPRARTSGGRPQARLTWTARRVARRLQRLVELDHREQVARRVLEPRGPPGADRRDPRGVGGRALVRLERDPPARPAPRRPRRRRARRTPSGCGCRRPGCPSARSRTGSRRRPRRSPRRAGPRTAGARGPPRRTVGAPSTSLVGRVVWTRRSDSSTARHRR